MSLDLHGDAGLVSFEVMLRRLRVPLLTLFSAFALAALPSCSRSTASPFTAQIRTVPPPSDADLAYTANDWSTDSTSGREVYSVRLDGTGVTRLTFCNDVQPCDMIEAAFSHDRTRAAIRQRLSPDQPPALEYYDLTRSATAELVPSQSAVSGVDWSTVGDILAYSAIGAAQGTDDLFRTDVVRPTSDNQQNTANLTCVPSSTAGVPPCDPTIVDRRPRLDDTTSTAVYERIAPGGKGEIYRFVSTTQETLVAGAGEGSGTLPGSDYTVGSDADPDYSPDASLVVFRRLMAATGDGLGTWDLLVANVDGSQVRTLVSGSAFRGAPDWRAGGILFPERDPGTGQYSLIVIQPDGSGRRTVLTLPTGFVLSYPRWLE
jgi:hypothetical protein